VAVDHRPGAGATISGSEAARTMADSVADAAVIDGLRIQRVTG
jgi:hypothetical protein